MANESEIFFNLLFVLITFVFVYPPRELVSIGLSAEQLYMKMHLIPHQSEDFVDHHIRRTTLNVVLHTALPGIYVALYNWHFGGDLHFVHGKSPLVAQLWDIAVFVALMIFLSAIGVTMYWLHFDRHPFMRDLLKYSSESGSSNNVNARWQSVATSVNDEYRRPEKTVSRCSPIATVVATENWVIKTTPYRVHIAHQSDTALIVVKSDTYTISQDTTADPVEFVNIIVKPTRTGVRSFSIRLNALYFAELQDRINRPITVLGGVNFSRTVVDRFVEAFKECVRNNPVYETDQELDSCFACMIAMPNVKLQRNCANTDVAGVPLAPDALCGNCFCRPMWCIDCMAKWFASRQDPAEKAVWLQQKCPCPMCRSRFCMQDVCEVRQLP